MGRRLTGGVLLGVLLYAGIAVWADLDELQASLTRFPLWPVPAALGLAFLNYCIRFLKWQRYLALLEIEVDRGTSFLIFLSGMSMSVTPGKMGEVFKSWLLRRVSDTPIHQSAPIVVAERFTDLLGYLILVAIGGIATLPEYTWIFWATLGLCGLVLVLAGSRRTARITYKVFSRAPYFWRLASRIEGSFASVRVLLAPRQIVLPTLLSVIGWGLECLGFWLIASALVEGAVEPLFCVFAYAFSAVAGAVAIVAPGGLVITEGLLGTLLRRRYEPVLAVSLELGGETLRKVARAKAAGAVILVRLCTLWFAVAVGLVATWVFTRRFGEPEELAEEGGEG